MVMAAPPAMCGEVHAVFGAMRDGHLNVGATPPAWGRPTGSTSHHRATAARTSDIASVQPDMEDMRYTNNEKHHANDAFCVCRALVEKQLNQPQTWA